MFAECRFPLQRNPGFLLTGTAVSNFRNCGEKLSGILIRCKIIGTQPLCYCKNLKLIDCEMIDTDLSFEKSDVEATLTAPIVSIKNPKSGVIRVPGVGEVIRDDPEAKGEVEVG